MDFETRGQRFRDSYAYIRQMSERFPRFDSALGRAHGDVDLLPKPAGGRLPMLVTGGSQQPPDWPVQHGDGWMIYPREAGVQAQIVDDWRTRCLEVSGVPKPVMQPLYVDLADDPDAPATPIHLGFRLGVHALVEYLTALRAGGVNHVALNLRFNRADIDATLDRLAAEVLPSFSE